MEPFTNSDRGFDIVLIAKDGTRYYNELTPFIVIVTALVRSIFRTKEEQLISSNFVDKIYLPLGLYDEKES